jgi:CheY-like chemotaxis protein/anti-sigma regulatory factor (Ser/Thr protein kinase)
MNLCTNAFHAMEDTEGTLHLALYQERVEDGEADGCDCGAGEYAHLIVEDDGCGIDGDAVDKIYEPYFTTKEDGKGTGLGLSIVHGIVKAHGGTIRVESRKNVGTTFHVLFPLSANIHSFAEVGASKLPGGEERVLLVDDEEQVRQAVKNMLEVIGYEVTTQQTSPGAYELLQNNPSYFDLVITDQTMPHMTGLELAGRILKTRPGLPIILCTGNSTGISQDLLAATGIREMLPKPFDLDQLSNIVRQTLDNPS